MAGCDYYHCDKCGCKCFYDADLDDRLTSSWVGEFAAICDQCAKTWEIKIVEKEAVTK